jgi:hypothetical protein
MDTRRTRRRIVASLALIALIGATLTALFAPAASATPAPINFYGSGITANSKPYNIIT